MIKKFTTLQLFSITDGRLSTTIDDVYDIFNHIFDDSFMTHQLPVVFGYLKQTNPQWFKDLNTELKDIKSIHGNDFETLIKAIRLDNKIHDIPQLTSAEKAGLIDYFTDNSLLIGKTKEEKRDSKINKLLD